MKIILKTTATIIGSVALLLLGLILWLTITDYRPAPLEQAELKKNSTSAPEGTFSILDWNLGYGGLGKDMDFFMDGGTGVRALEDEYNANWKGIWEQLSKETYDMYFFQEVDRRSTRSYRNDQYNLLGEMFPLYDRSFAPNYKVKYIPSPTIVGRQYGSVYSGLAIYSRYAIDRAERISLPGNYSWPKKIFFLDRCMLAVSMKSASGKEIVLINTHKSAYDQGGFLKKEQMEFMKAYGEDLYGKGASVIIGGDWNSYMPGITGTTFPATERAPDFYQALPEDWKMDGWTWATDNSSPTNRSLAAPYRAGETFTTVIDGYLLSPDLEAISVRTLDLQFRYSDHNPVVLEVRLR